MASLKAQRTIAAVSGSLVSSGVDLRFRYVGARVPRQVQREAEFHCLLDPPRMLVVRGGDAEARQRLAAEKPPYLVVEFEDRRFESSEPLADLTDLL